MQARQKKFLYVAVPLTFVVMGLAWFVSIRASVVVTVLALGAFGWILTRPAGRTLAHTPCVFCKRKIIFEHEGDVCGTCDESVHGACLDEHRMQAHAPTKDQPFR